MNTLSKKYHQLFFSTIILLTFIATSHSYSQNGWFLQNSGVTSNLTSIYFADPLKGWAVGSFGRIINTTDGGNTWQIQNSNDTIHLTGVAFANENTGWAWGNHWYYNPWSQYYTILLKTINGGENWNTLYKGGLGPYFSCMKVFDENNLLMGHKGNDFSGFISNGSLLKSINGGDNWSEAVPHGFLEYGFGYTGISFINENTGWVMASLTSDVGSKHKVLKTTNSSADWQIIWADSGQLGLELNGILFVNETVGFMKDGYINKFYKSTDGGITWFDLTSVNNVKAFTFVDENTGWALHGGSGSDQIIKTLDGGNSWFSQPHQTTNYLNQFFLLNPDTGWVAGANGTILKTITGGLTNITSTSNETPNEFRLHQNFPNPFNPVTKIKFDVPFNEHVSLTVFNSLGQQVAVLVNQSLQPGSYEYTFDSGGLSSGVYYYTLNSGSFGQTKRMVLLK